jgi:hypothetical protein
LQGLLLQPSQESADSLLRFSGQESGLPRRVFLQVNKIFFGDYAGQSLVSSNRKSENPHGQ